MINIFAWIVMIVMITGIIAYANPQFFPDMKEKIENIDIPKNIPKVKTNDMTIIEVSSENEDKLMSKCEESFNDCKDIYHKKLGLSVSISEIGQINNIDKANEFYNIWIERLPDWNSIGIKDRQQKINEGGFPQVLIAYSIGWPGSNVKLPSIAVCNEEGELTQDSKGILSCG